MVLTFIVARTPRLKMAIMMLIKLKGSAEDIHMGDDGWVEERCAAASEAHRVLHRSS